MFTRLRALAAWRRTLWHPGGRHLRGMYRGLGSGGRAVVRMTKVFPRAFMPLYTGRLTTAWSVTRPWQ